MKLIKSLILSLAVLVGFSSTSNARDITLSMWTHNQLYVDYFNTYLEEVQAAFPDDNITFDFQVTPDMATNSLTAIASGSEHTDLLGIEISGFGLFMVDDIISDNQINFLGNKVTIEGINFSKNDYYFGIRPEHFSVSTDCEYKFEPKIDLIENLGNEKIAYIKIDNHDISAKIPSQNTIGNTIGFNSKNIFVFNENGKRIRA